MVIKRPRTNTKPSPHRLPMTRPSPPKNAISARPPPRPNSKISRTIETNVKSFDAQAQTTLDEQKRAASPKIILNQIRRPLRRRQGPHTDSYSMVLDVADQPGLRRGLFQRRKRSHRCRPQVVERDLAPVEFQTPARTATPPTRRQRIIGRTDLIAQRGERMFASFFALERGPSPGTATLNCPLSESLTTHPSAVPCPTGITVREANVLVGHHP